MMIQIATYLLLIAIVLRFSPRWVGLVRSIFVDRQQRTMIEQMDWDRPRRRLGQSSSWRFWE